MYKYITLILKKCKCINSDKPFKEGMVYDCFELPEPPTELICDWQCKSCDWQDECKRRILQYCVIYKRNENNCYVTYPDCDFNDFFTILENEKDSEQIETKVVENNDNININIYR